MFQIQSIISILGFTFFIYIWYVNKKLIRSLIITGISYFLAALVIGIGTAKLNQLFPFIPVIVVTGNSIWTGLLLTFLEFPIAYYLAKKFRDTIPAFFAISDRKDGYEIMSILYPELLKSTTTVMPRGGGIPQVVEETREPKFNKVTLSL